MKRLALATALFAVAAGAAQAETYEIDTRHTQVHFTYSHMGLSNITGRFADATGTIVYDPADPSSASIEISVPIASVSTGVTAMDDHFKRDDCSTRPGFRPPPSRALRCRRLAKASSSSRAT
nr:YceI family protein [Pseudofulvimonas gallinarii]